MQAIFEKDLRHMAQLRGTNGRKYKRREFYYGEFPFVTPSFLKASEGF